MDIASRMISRSFSVVASAMISFMLSIMPFNVVFMPIEVFAGTMRGVGYSVVPTVITGCCICLFRILWLAAVVRRWHTLTMLTICYPISWVLAAGVFFAVYLRGNWLRSRILQCGMEPESEKESALCCK